MTSKKLICALAVLSIVSCKNANQEESSETKIAQQEEAGKQEETPSKEYPTEVASIFEAHGGLARWEEMNNLCYEIPGGAGEEVHTISLKDRRVRIENKKWSIGHDGKEVWLLQNEEGAYAGNARFYHNLMFYFYAMPFVLADDGITFTKVAPSELDGTQYPGIKVSYNNGIGDSSNDEYILYYSPEDYTMKWLAYTVTFGKDQKSDKWSYIKYSQWDTINGLVLPKTLSWYKVEDGKPTEKANDLPFNKVTITDTVLADSIFAKPEGAIVSPLK